MKKRLVAFLLIVSLTFLLTPSIFAADTVTAWPTASAVLVNGESVDFDVYNINDYNFFKLRDIAYVLSGTAKQFNVEYDSARDAISLVSGQSYVVVGGEMESKGVGDKVATPTGSSIYLDGSAVNFTAYYIGGNNYFRLRDIGTAFDFGVDWDDTSNTVRIDTDKSYTLETGAVRVNRQSNYTATDSSQTFTNDIFTMEIPANAFYRIGIEESILDYCDWVQEASGLSLFPPGSSLEKLSITNDGGAAWASGNILNVKNTDYILDVPGAEDVYLNGLTQVLLYRTALIDCMPFQLAFAILNSAKVARTQGLNYSYWHLMHDNFSYTDNTFQSEIVSSSFEQYYRTLDEWDAFIYGFRFGVYLEYVYGEDIFPRLIKGYGAKMGLNPSTQNEFIDFLKEETSADVFEGFVSWYWNNLSVFDSTPPPAVSQGIVVFMPIIHNNIDDDGRFFISNDRYELHRTITFDFIDSHAYAWHTGHLIKGIGGDFLFEEPVTIEAYDIEDKLIETRAIQSGFHELTFPDAATLTISGYTGEFLFTPSFDGSYE